MLEEETVPCQRVEVRRLGILVAVAAEVIGARGVERDEEDVGVANAGGRAMAPHHPEQRQCGECADRRHGGDPEETGARESHG